MIQLNDKTKSILEWVYCVVIALVIALLIRHFIGTPTVVKHVSMVPTLQPNQRLILNKWPANFGHDFNRGDIITFEAPSSSSTKTITAEYNNENKNFFESFVYYGLEIGKTSYIKRIIGIEGDHIEIKEGKVFLNGKELEESYLSKDVKTETQNSNLKDFTVPEGYVFAMGDNRTQSLDCRSFGCIPINKIESKVWIRFWPFDMFGEVK